MSSSPSGLRQHWDAVKAEMRDHCQEFQRRSRLLDTAAAKVLQDRV